MSGTPRPNLWCISQRHWKNVASSGAKDSHSDPVTKSISMYAMLSRGPRNCWCILWSKNVWAWSWKFRMAPSSFISAKYHKSWDLTRWDTLGPKLQQFCNFYERKQMLCMDMYGLWVAPLSESLVNGCWSPATGIDWSGSQVLFDFLQFKVQMLHMSDVEFPVMAFSLSHVCACTPWTISSDQGRWSCVNRLIQSCFAQPARNLCISDLWARQRF